MRRICQSTAYLAFLLILASIPQGRTSEPEIAGGAPQSQESSGQKYAKYFFYDFKAPEIPHCPVRFARIDKPILWFTLGVGMKDGKYNFSKPPADKIE